MNAKSRQAAFRQHFYRQLEHIATHATYDSVARCLALRQLILELFERATEQDKLHFTTHFARISYAAHKFGIPATHIHQERRFRQRQPARLSAEDLTRQLETGYQLATELIRALFGGAVPQAWVHYLTTPYPFPYQRPEAQARYLFLRVVAVEIDEDEQCLYVREEARPEQIYCISYAPDRVDNPLVAEALRIVRRVSGIPVTLNLLRATLRSDDLLYPEQIVVVPDYLIDVTAVAESFSNPRSYQPWSAGIVKKLLPYQPALPLVRGNLVNYFLDRLIEKPDIQFVELQQSIFQQQPLALSLFDDRQIKELMESLKHHFLTLQKFVHTDMVSKGIERERILLEPTYLSPAYGVQGRLDLLQPAEGPHAATSIVELKTSKYWQRNGYGINQPNYIQTLLYDLMINEAIGEGANVRSYILYSNDFENGLKYAPPENQQKLEAIAARNQLLAVELLLAQLGDHPDRPLLAQVDHLLQRLRPTAIKHLSGFSLRDHQLVGEVLESLDPLERTYFGAFLGFTAREQQLAKTGAQKTDGINGLASLWLDDREKKRERFELLDGLTFAEYHPATAQLTLLRPAADNPLVKFRQGDIVVLYATEQETTRTGEVTNDRVLKSSIVTITPEQVVLQLRSQQLNDSLFRQARFFSIEKDVLDSSFRNHYQGLFTWATAEPAFRQRWLGLQPPRQAKPLTDTISPTLTDEQNHILQRIIPAPDYFLLWGPPGTGKTSQMLHHLVRHLLYHSEESLLLVAYTNRAVDEICESLERIITADGDRFTDYLRIGSRAGVSPRFRERLLQVRSEQINRRTALRELIEKTRVVVGTVASVGGKGELFALKAFDRLIVDEASQILEPLLAGLLPRAPRALLIGDHRQLPAVVQQGAATTVVRNQPLRDIGLTDLATSLFERLYLTAQQKGWHWACAQLRHQGRMHRDIMAFPAQQFYAGQLEILPPDIPHHHTQCLPLASFPTASEQDDSPASAAWKTLERQRLVFLPTPPDHRTPDPKVNGYEAELLVALIACFTRLYASTENPIKAGDIGIITPYRAQIAHIYDHLHRAGLPLEHFTVDTVERYQGGARRIILLSLCTNNFRQIQALSQISTEGVDRKLNVAMTRAREHLVLLGCPDILRQSPIYNSLLDFIETQKQTAAEEKGANGAAR